MAIIIMKTFGAHSNEREVDDDRDLLRWARALWSNSVGGSRAERKIALSCAHVRARCWRIHPRGYTCASPGTGKVPRAFTRCGSCLDDAVPGSVWVCVRWI